MHLERKVMEDSNSKDVSTANLKKLFTKVDQTCKKHHINLVKARFGKDQEPFCQLCEEERLAKEDKDKSAKAYKQIQVDRTSNVLKNDSLISDDDLKKATFDTFKPESDEAKRNLKLARHIAYAYMETDMQFNTLITGSPGRGKSHLALSMLKAINSTTKEPMSCLFVSVDELIRKIKSSFDYPDSPYTEEAMVKKLTSVDLLVMDDLGSESSFNGGKPASDFVQNILFGIFNGRNRTIITTNLNSDELANTYNPKILSRMERGIRGHLIKFTNATSDKRIVSF